MFFFQKVKVLCVVFTVRNMLWYLPCTCLDLSVLAKGEATYLNDNEKAIYSIVLTHYRVNIFGVKPLNDQGIELDLE